MFGFDAEAHEAAWFDASLLPEGWFDPDLISGTAASAFVPRIMVYVSTLSALLLVAVGCL